MLRVVAGMPPFQHHQRDDGRLWGHYPGGTFRQAGGGFANPGIDGDAGFLIRIPAERERRSEGNPGNPGNPKRRGLSPA